MVDGEVVFASWLSGDGEAIADVCCANCRPVAASFQHHVPRRHCDWRALAVYSLGGVYRSTCGDWKCDS